MKHDVTLIPGDGIGPEISAATRRVIDASGAKIEWHVTPAGGDLIEKYKTPLPDNVIESIRKTKVAIKGPIATPIGSGFRSVNVKLRQTLDLFACLRPCKWYKGVKSNYKNVDIVVVRENT
ncbi:MAG: isocitrate/isopropylmalate family dehydrogenase, partial [Candidatus Omnitrophota bacterium]